jgi:hypothetical protein
MWKIGKKIKSLENIPTNSFFLSCYKLKKNKFGSIILKYIDLKGQIEGKYKRIEITLQQAVREKIV